MARLASECLHSVIWTLASKNQHASLLSVMTRAVAEAVLVFNRGRRETNESIALGLGCTAGSCLLRRSLEKDKKRLKSTTAFLSNDANKRRHAKRHKGDGSTDYSPGQF